MAHIFAGTIDTQGDWELFSTAIDKTLTADKKYTIQCLQLAYLRAGDDVDGGFLVKNPETYVEWKYDGDTDLYIKTNAECTVIVAED